MRCWRGVVRELLETLHPDGLTGEDVQDVLTRCARAAALWFPVVDVDSLVTVLTGALGVADVEENPRRPERAVEAAILVIADLLSAAEVSADGYVRRALDEIARAETVEMPDSFRVRCGCDRPAGRSGPRCGGSGSTGRSDGW